MFVVQVCIDEGEWTEWSEHDFLVEAQAKCEEFYGRDDVYASRVLDTDIEDMPEMSIRSDVIPFWDFWDRDFRRTGIVVYERYYNPYDSVATYDKKSLALDWKLWGF